MRIDCIFGTRPEAIKMLPVVRELRTRGVRVRTVFTSQHPTMAPDVFSAFSVCPDVTLPPLAEGDMATRLGGMLSSLCAMTDDGAEGAEQSEPRAVLVQGDTLTALAGGLFGFLSGRRVIHLEAGLRTHAPRTPYPEEAVRRTLAALCDLHLAPTPFAVQNLLREGVPRASVRLVGNTTHDALRTLMPSAVPYPKTEGRYLWLLTLHRRECDSQTRRAILAAVRALLDEYPTCDLLLPVHPSPAVKEDAEAALGGHARARLVPPMPPRAFYGALAAADLVLTDSGGVQEEAALLGANPLVLREVTEREEELYGGRLTLVGTRPEAISAAVRERMQTLLAFPALTRREQTLFDNAEASSPAVRAAEEIACFLQA